MRTVSPSAGENDSIRRGSGGYRRKAGAAIRGSQEAPDRGSTESLGHARRRRRRGCDHSPLHDIDDARGNSMQLDGIRRRQNYRDATFGQSVEKSNDVLVEQQTLAAEGFVEQNRARRTDQSLRKAEPLDQTWRQAADAASGVDVQADVLHRRFHLTCAARRGQIVERGVVLECLAYGQKGVIASALRNVRQSRWNVVDAE